MSEWTETTLGEVLTLEYGKSLREQDRDGNGYPVFGSNGEVGRHSEALVTGPGIIVGRKGTAGSVTYSHEDFSPIDTTYFVRLKSANLTMPFAHLMLVNADLPSVTAQTGVPGLNRDRAYAVRAVIPPTAEQHRIVDTMAAVEDQIGSLVHEFGRARQSLDLLSTELLARLPASRALGEFTATRSGPSYAAADVSKTPSESSVPAIGIPNTKPDGSMDMSDVGHVVGLSETVGRIDDSSLVLIRTNGNRQRIGNVYMPGAEADGHIVSAFQFLMKVADPADREFVYWALREPSMQAAMSDSASGTTGLGNMAVKWLNAAHVPWSDDRAERAQTIAPLRGQRDVVEALAGELDRLRAFRRTLLTSLLNQEIEIPESYDRLLSEVS